MILEAPGYHAAMAVDGIVNRACVDTVLLDMDGTVLDLYFDNCFWQEHLPRRYAQVVALSCPDSRGSERRHRHRPCVQRLIDLLPI